jgi:hypothetical protein
MQRAFALDRREIIRIGEGPVAVDPAAAGEVSSEVSENLEQTGNRPLNRRDVAVGDKSRFRLGVAEGDTSYDDGIGRLELRRRLGTGGGSGAGGRHCNEQRHQKHRGSERSPVHQPEMAARLGHDGFRLIKITVGVIGHGGQYGHKCVGLTGKSRLTIGRRLFRQEFDMGWT